MRAIPSNLPTSVTNVPERPKIPLHSSFIPLLLILLTLNFSATRECLSVYHHRKILQMSNDETAERLEKTSRKAAFVEKLRLAIIKLAETDAAAARLKGEFFSTPTAPKPDLPPLAPPTPKKELPPLVPRQPDPAALPVKSSDKSHP